MLLQTSSTHEPQQWTHTHTLREGSFCSFLSDISMMDGFQTHTLWAEHSSGFTASTTRFIWDVYECVCWGVCVYARACVNRMWERKNWVATEKQLGAEKLQFFLKNDSVVFSLSEIHNLTFIQNYCEFQMKKRALIKFRMFSSWCIQNVPQVNGEPQVSIKACGRGSVWPEQFVMKGFCKLT